MQVESAKLKVFKINTSQSGELILLFIAHNLNYSFGGARILCHLKERNN